MFSPDDEDSSPDPLPPDVPDRWTISAAFFKLLADRGRLTPSERAALAARPRFYSMPWLVPAGPAPGEDDLFP